jgi:hypothetical protein
MCCSFLQYVTYLYNPREVDEWINTGEVTRVVRGVQYQDGVGCC